MTITTADVIRALRRRYREPDGQFACVVEYERIDLLAVGQWRSTGYAWHGHEIKVSRSDWLREIRPPGPTARHRRLWGEAKHGHGMSMCDRWWLVAPPGVTRPGELPPGWGHLELHGDGRLRVVVRAPTLRPAPPPLRDLAGASPLEQQSTVTRWARAERAARPFRRVAYAEADARHLAEAWPGTPEQRDDALYAAAYATGRVSTLNTITARRADTVAAAWALKQLTCPCTNLEQRRIRGGGLAFYCRDCGALVA